MPSPNPLRDHLIKSASATAKAALDRVSGIYVDDSATLFLSAGMTVEFLLRAVVADMSPALMFVTRNNVGEQAAMAMTRVHRDSAVDMGWLLKHQSADLTSVIRPIALQIAPALADHGSDADGHHQPPQRRGAYVRRGWRRSASNVDRDGANR